jgi:ligand-binding sensor domain-containing protein
MICLTSSFATGKIINYAQTNRINDIQASNGKLLVFTGGGVYTLDLKTGGYHSQFGTIEFPDPDMTASCIDDDGTIWVGSANGYINSWNPEKLKWIELVNSYQSAGWKITSMVSYGPYLIIGSSKGLSLFDRKEKRARKNASKFSNYTITQVNALAISNDRLYVGLEKGVVYIDNISTKLNSYNFFDPGIWKTDSTRSGSANAFLTINDSLFVFNQPAVVYNGMLLQAKGDSLVFGEKVLFQTHDPISCLKAIGSDCWIGTKNDCIYKYSSSESETKHIRFEGPTFQGVNGLTIDNNGHVFIIPSASLAGGEWWRGFQEFRNNSWFVYNTTLTPNIGSMPENTKTKAITKSREGDIWIATDGAHCKRFTNNDNSWSQYCTYSKGGSQGKSSCSPDCGEPWAKSDAVAQDSSGFVWVGCWQNPDGSLICFDPANKPNPDANGTPQAHYRRFFEAGNPNKADNIDLLHVDVFGTIFVANSTPNLMVLKHNGDPIKNGVDIVTTISSLGKFSDAVSFQSGTTYFLTTTGLYSYNPETRNTEKVENIGSGIVAIESEEDNILWYASTSDGLVRYDLLNKERLSSFTKVDGLVSTAVKDLALDRENGIMWIATDQGVTRLSIGVKSQLPDIKKTTVFPVPFRKNRDKTINFHYVSPKADITVYSLHGSLVGKPVKILNNVYQAQFAWTVPANVSPGTYYYIIKDGESSAKGRLLITP